MGVEVRFDLFCQFQTGFVETLLVHPDAGADAQYPEILRVVAQTETLAKRERAGRCRLSRQRKLWVGSLGFLERNDI